MTSSRAFGLADDGSSGASDGLGADAVSAGAPPVAPSVAGLGFIGHRVGDRIKDRYEVVERLGGGNFGSVYRVIDSAVGNVLACKEMHVLDDPNTPIDERAAAFDLFKREALNLATLRHPNIPAAYFDQEEGSWRVCPVCGLDFSGHERCPDHGAQLLKVEARYYLMMDFVDGSTLEEMARGEMQRSGAPLPEARCLEWMFQIASAVRTLHRVGIIHRDIKPDNIKIRRADENAVLLDFGLTKKVEEAGGYGTAPLSGTARFGTAGYAPENPSERQKPEKRSDIHALGMTLYRLLSGRDPQHPRELREMRDFSPRYFNRDVSPEAERLILISIAPELGSRLQSIDEFLTELQSIRAPDEGAAPLPPFVFADGQKARSATELARLLESHTEEASNYLFNGMFAAWLMQNGFAASARAAEQVVKTHASSPPRALELLRRALYPSGTSHVLPRVEVRPGSLNLGSLDSGEVARAALRLINTGPGLAWGELSVPMRLTPGQSALSSAVNSILSGRDPDAPSALPGLIVPPEFEGNDAEIEITLDTSRVPVGAYASHLEVRFDGGTVRVPVSYSVVPLELRVEPESLDFGSIRVGRRLTAQLAVLPAKANSGGTPRGTVYVGPSLAGCLAPERFEGREPLPVTIDAAQPQVVARLYEGLLQIDTNGGRLRVPVRYRVTLPPAALGTILVTGVGAGLLGGALLRFTYVLINPQFALAWLLLPQGSGHTLARFELGGFYALIIGAGLGAAAGWQWARRLRRIPTRERPGLFKGADNGALAALPILGLATGAFGGYVAAQTLHWTLWSVGDWLLFPLARELPGTIGALAQQYAPLAWALAGATGGLAWGLTRVLAATGRGAGPILFLVFAALSFLFLLLNATVNAG